MRSAGVFLDGRLCAALWPVLRQAVRDRQQMDGCAVRPAVAHALDAMREAASIYLATVNMSAIGHDVRTSADIAAQWLRDEDRDDLDARQLADLLRCTPRHARRLAFAYGVEPRTSKPYRWARPDVAALIDRYRSA